MEYTNMFVNIDDKSNKNVCKYTDLKKINKIINEELHASVNI